MARRAKQVVTETTDQAVEQTVDELVREYVPVVFTEKTTNARVLVATPNYTNLFSSESHVSHMECSAAWTRWNINFTWSVVGRTFVHFARTMLSKALLDGDFTHILWLDDDAVIAPDTLPRFLEHDKEVVIAPYHMRRFPYEIGILTSQIGDFHNHGSYRNLTLDDMDQGIIECDGGGTHCMLVKASVFTKKGETDTYFTAYPPQLMELLDRMDPTDKDIIDHYIGDMPDERLSLREESDLGKPYFVMPKVGTEDMLFCYRVKKKGVKIWVDTDVDTGHVGFPPVITRAHRKMAEEMQKQHPQHAAGTKENGIPSIFIGDPATHRQIMEGGFSTLRKAGIIKEGMNIF